MIEYVCMYNACVEGGTDTLRQSHSFMPRLSIITLNAPIVSVSPVRKSTSPSANRAESNRNMTPRNKKTHPYKEKK